MITNRQKGILNNGTLYRWNETNGYIYEDLTSTLPKNQAAPIEKVISDLFRITKMFDAFVSLWHKSPKPKGNCDYHAVAMTMAKRSICL